MEPIPTPEDIAAAMQHPLWSAFVAYIVGERKMFISTACADDWWPWWQCFAAGAEAVAANKLQMMFDEPM